MSLSLAEVLPNCTLKTMGIYLAEPARLLTDRGILHLIIFCARIFQHKTNFIAGLCELWGDAMKTKEKYIHLLSDFQKKNFK